MTKNAHLYKAAVVYVDAAGVDRVVSAIAEYDDAVHRAAVEGTRGAERAVRYAAERVVIAARLIMLEPAE